MTSQQTLNLQERSLEHARSAAGMAEFPEVPNEYLRAAMFLSKHAGTTRRGKWKVLAEALGLKEDYDAWRSNYGKFVQTAIKQLKKEAYASSVPPPAAALAPTPSTNAADLQYLAQTVDKLAMVVADRDAKAADRDAKAADRDEQAADERLELQRDVVQLRREAAQRDEKQDERNAKQDERNAKADKEREVLLEATTTAVKTAVESKKESELALNLATSLRGDVEDGGQNGGLNKSLPAVVALNNGLRDEEEDVKKKEEQMEDANDGRQAQAGSSDSAHSDSDDDSTIDLTTEDKTWGNDHLKQKTAELEQIVAQLKQENGTLRKLVKLKDAEIKTVLVENKKKDAQIRYLRTQLALQNGVIETQILDIREFKGKYKSMVSAYNSLSDDMGDMGIRMDDLEGDMNNCHNKVDDNELRSRGRELQAKEDYANANERMDTIVTKQTKLQEVMDTKIEEEVNEKVDHKFETEVKERIEEAVESSTFQREFDKLQGHVDQLDSDHQDTAKLASDLANKQRLKDLEREKENEDRQKFDKNQTALGRYGFTSERNNERYF
eukprot:scaffold7718_cov73-Skeletonema_menzelii.AAC.1